MPSIDAELIKALTPAGLLLLLTMCVVLAFMFGLIRPRSAIKEIRDDRDARLADLAVMLADKDRQIAEWRAAHTGSEAAREVQAAALRESLETSRAQVEMIRAWRTAADRAREESEPA